MRDIWDKEIMYLKKVGPKRAEVLKQECNIATYRDLLNYFPRKYVDRSHVFKVKDLIGVDASVTLVGKITRFSLNKTKRGKAVLQGVFSDGTGEIDLTWFQGVKWIQNNLPVGEEIAIFGRPNSYKGRLQLTHPEIDKIKDDGTQGPQQIVPYYPSTDKLQRVGLDSKGIRNLLKQLMEEVSQALRENLPPEFREKHRLLGRPESLRFIHFPPHFEALYAAQRRLKFEELFYFQLLLARRRKKSKIGHQARPFGEVGRHFLDFYEHHLPFNLTGAQKRVLKEIRKDLGRSIQMNRLIQGDVGAGKTMVAFMTMLLAKDNGFQTAFMAPTAILADQHRRKITKMAEKVDIRTAFLVGGQRKAERKAELQRVASGEADIVIGTHALIEPTVKFHRLGLTVIDEQHKFGVVQRARLWSKAQPYPHNMVMTATPIPRTLAMTVYGDIDVSVIDELPPGRKPIKTMVYRESKRLEVLGFIRSEIEKGRQAYVVYPLVEESEKLDLIAAEKGFELLEKYFKGFRVGMVHGKMKPENKDFEMQRFVRNETQLLVSTTVIEVGVDVPNSTLMLIENAERFGLSQLHQLRGRVGRGQNQSYCILMAGNKISADGKKRLKAMYDTHDGFKISEIDLELRGPGDFLGTRQSGLPLFTIANIVEDQEILSEAREAAFDIIDRDPDLSLNEHQAIKLYFERFLKSQANLGTVA